MAVSNYDANYEAQKALFADLFNDVRSVTALIDQNTHDYLYRKVLVDVREILAEIRPYEIGGVNLIDTAAWMYHLNAHAIMAQEDLPEDDRMQVFVDFAAKWTALFSEFHNIPADKLYTLRTVQYTKRAIMLQG